MPERELTTEERIKQAATKIFIKKGLDGARMQDIADEAAINKAMLHYYFKSKQNLFEIIFQEKASRMFQVFSEVLNKEQEAFEDKIKALVWGEMQIIAEFPSMPVFVLSESMKNPKMLDKLFGKLPIRQIFYQFQQTLDKEVAKGNIKPIKLEHLLLHIMSLSVYPFIAKPVIQRVLDKTDREYANLLEERKHIVSDLIIQSLKV